jgi:hypothetical protein
MMQNDIVIEETAIAGTYRQRRLALTEKWMKSKVIEPCHHEAALIFQYAFEAAGLRGRFPCMDFDRVDSSPDHQDRMIVRVIDAKKRVADACAAVGKIGGSVLWDVIGNEMTLSDYASRQHYMRLNVHDVKGRLICALDLLADHYGVR